MTVQQPAYDLFGVEMPATQPLPARHAVQPGVQPFQGGPLPQRPAPAPPAALLPKVVPMSGAAACSFVLGLLGPVTFGLLGIVAIVVGSVARRRTATGVHAGNGLACVGIMLGWFSIVGWVLVVLLLSLGAAAIFGR